MTAGLTSAPAFAAEDSGYPGLCSTEVATYVITPGGDRIQKYLDWNPVDPANSALLSTGASADLHSSSLYFAGGYGVIYEIASSGKLQSYKDTSASGGSLLTPVKTYPSNWTGSRRAWSSGNSIFTINAAGGLEVWHQRSRFGDGTVEKLYQQDPRGSASIAFAAADDVWADDTTTYTLKDGQIRAWPFTAATDTSSASIASSGSLVANTDATQKQGWGFGGGLTRTAASNGVVQAYSGSTVTNSEYGVLPVGEVLADKELCLRDAGETKPTLGAASDDADIPAAVAEEPSEPPAPSSPDVVKGRFTLGSGAPAAGLPVRIEAIDAIPDDGTEAEMPTLGTTTTDANGNWSLTLPENLPADVQQAAADNGGLVNVMATVSGHTSTGVAMGAITHLTAAADTASLSAQALASNNTSAASAELLPLSTGPDNFEISSQQDTAYANSWAVKHDAEPVETLDENETPQWQNATGDLPKNYSPYVVGSQDTSALAITPYDGGCDRTKSSVISRKIYYTTVGEGHAYWDAKASVDYDSKLSSTVDIAAKVGSNWTLVGGASLGSSMSVTTGYTNKGPYYAKQWRVPIKYDKIKETWKCGGNNTFTRYVIKPGKYTIPAGGATGKYGKDMRNKDGTHFLDSPKSHRAYVTHGSYFQLSKNRSVKFSSAVSAYGVSLGASTAYDRDHKQRITAGDYTNARHDIWGKNDIPSGKPGVFYSY